VRRRTAAAAGAATFALTMLLGAAPAYADIGGPPLTAVAILLVVFAGICVAAIGLVSWLVLRGLANRRREREADARRAQHRAREAEERRLRQEAVGTEDPR
jgi:hypothetical protein